MCLKSSQGPKPGFGCHGSQLDGWNMPSKERSTMLERIKHPPEWA